MFRPRTLFALAALTVTLAAEDFGPVVKAAGLVFPGKSHFGVVCNYGRSKQAVGDLLRALPEGATLTVVDAHDWSQVMPAASMLRLRDVEMLALLPKDSLVRDGSPFATALVNHVAGTIPAFGTTPAAIKNGCALALGAATGWELLVNPAMVDPSVKGIIGPIEITQAPKSAEFDRPRFQLVSLVSH